MDDPVLIAIVRNESLRLPYFLQYYRSIGFKDFMMIDNGSDDGTKEFLLEQPDVRLFYEPSSFHESKFGMQWINEILNTHCHDRWVLNADADELLTWPNSERESIQDLTAKLDAASAQGLFVFTVDMYSDKPFGEVGYVRGEPFLPATPFFDRTSSEFVPLNRCPFRMYFGGVRTRKFREIGAVKLHPPATSKLPFVRWQRGQGFACAAHMVTVEIKLAPMRGALLHFKMFDDLPEKCRVEVMRREHADNAWEYWALGQTIEQAPTRCFFDPQHSVRYEGTSQLVSLGFMHSRDPFGTSQPVV